MSVDLHHIIGEMTRAGYVGEPILLRAMLHGLILHTQIAPGSSGQEFKRLVGTIGTRPAVLTIPADDGSEHVPADFPAITRIIRWANAIIVHATGAEAEHYHSAVAAAQQVQRVLLIECCSRTEAAWVAPVAAAEHRPAVLLIRNRSGLHPVPVERSAVH